ncbi:hypothetical protein DXG01_013172, partial [Tephrocybe rancida]
MRSWAPVDLGKARDSTHRKATNIAYQQKISQTSINDPNPQREARSSGGGPRNSASNSPQSDSDFKDDDGQILDLIGRLKSVFADTTAYENLLSQRESDAQRILDIFQRLLDVRDVSLEFRQSVIAATQRLASQSGLFPTCYSLGNVADSDTLEYSGGFADIYKGELHGRAICLKSIRRTQQTDIDHLSKVFLKEAILWGQLYHPNVVTFYGLYSFKNTISFVSPWMSNGNITTFLRKQKDCNRALDIAQGVKFLHENGIVHGNLKSRNILVNDIGQACLADFGISSVISKETTAFNCFSYVTQDCTARWQAPELFDPETEETVYTTKESDIYAFGCLAYEIFTGEVPFARISRDTTIMYKVIRGERPSRPPATSLSWVVWGLTEGIWLSMESCWSGDLTKRPAISKVVAELEKALPPNVERGMGHGDYLLPGQFREFTRLGKEKIELS